ncbi:hypothetical protein EGH09_08780, partial [Brevibacillus laterosporus]
MHRAYKFRLYPNR